MSSDVVLANVRCVLNKRDELESFVSSLKPAMVALTETWLTSDVLDAEVNFTGYNLYRCDRLGRGGGGVILHVRADLSARLIQKTSDVEGHYEGLWCNVKFASGGYDTVGVVYRTPGTDPSTMTADLKQFASGGRCLVLGDFNIPMIDWKTNTCNQRADMYTKEIHLTLCELFLHQHVRTPTRVTTSSSNILDLVLSPRESDVTGLQITAPIGSSDHSTVVFAWNHGAPPLRSSLKTRNIWKIPFSQMKAAAYRINWNLDRTNVDQLWAFIKGQISNLVSTFAPPWKERKHSQGPPWFDAELRKELKKRNRAWRYFRTSGEGYEHYKLIRNRCTSLKLAKRKSFEDKLAEEAKLVPKKLYAYLRRRTRVDSRIPVLHKTDGEIDDDVAKANAFADHYEKVYAREPHIEMGQNPRNLVTLPDGDITMDEVLESIKLLRRFKSPGPDDLHPAIFKELAEIVAEPLAVLFTLSLRTGKLPEEWKTAVVAPMYKAGDKHQPQNYRPVSLTCVACKIMEKIIAHRIRQHFEDNELFHPGQHGFRRKHSCITNLLIARERWSEAKSAGNDVEVIFIDFSKAFDKVPHRRLLWKLGTYGISGDTLRWLEDFLVGRSFSVRVHLEKSSFREMYSGVPQGSVLGPLLFLIYVNDLLELIKSPCLMYADDLKIWRVITDLEDPDSLQNDLNTIMKWAAEWHLPLNADKCVHMHIGKENTVNAFHIGGVLLPLTDCERDLGVFVSNNLKTSRHTEKVCASARGILGAIRRSFYKLSPTAFKTLYASHVRPRLEYGGAAAYPITLGELDQIERVQRAATRLVDGTVGKSYDERLQLLNLYPQSYRRLRGDLIMVRNILRGNLAPELLQEFPLRDDDRRRGHRLHLLKQSSGLLSSKYCLSRRVVNVWNSLPAALVDEENDALFKVKLDQQLRDMWRRDQS